MGAVRLDALIHRFTTAVRQATSVARTEMLLMRELEDVLNGVEASIKLQLEQES